MVRIQGSRGSKYTDLLQDPTVKRWHRNVAQGSQITADVYLRQLGRVCEAHSVTPASLAAMGGDEHRDFLVDLVADMEGGGKAGSYIAVVLKVVKSWLAFNGIRVEQKIKVRGALATPTLEGERVPTQEEVRRIFMAARPQQRCCAVLMAHGGLRPEALGNYRATDGLRLHDLPDLTVKGKKVTFERIPAMILVRPELSKAGHRYFTFIGKEGADYIKGYLEERLRRREELSEKTDLIHPEKMAKAFLTTINVGDGLRRAIRGAGFRWRPYVLRAYFDTQLLLAESKGKITHSYRAFFMGHKGDIEARYTTNKGRLPQDLVDDMRDAYRRSSPFLETTKGGDSEGELKVLFKRQMLAVAGLGEAEVAKMDLEAMTDGDLQRIVRDRLLGTRLANGGSGNGSRQKVVPLAEVDAYIERGWEWVTQLPDNRAVLRLTA